MICGQFGKKENNMRQFFKHYGFLLCMLIGMAGGCVTGLL